MNDRDAQGQDALNGAEGFVRRFCILPESAYLPLMLWAVATHIPDVFGAFPYVALLSPVKGCGKTRVFEILELLCANPQRVTSASPASIFRMMKDVPTLFLDEVEALRNNKPSESAQAILAILNAGHRKGATVTRCLPPNWDVGHFPVYDPKAFAAIGRLPDTLADRCICISMQRKTASQTVARFLFVRTPAEAEPIRNAIAAWAVSNRDAVHQTYERMGDLAFLADREADLWMPVFAVCAVAAPERVDELKKCALALCGDKAADDLDDSLALTLLADVRSVWAPGNQNMTTASMIETLASLPESLWAESEHKLTPKRLAGMLRPFGIEPRQVRVGIGTGKGYQRGDPEAAFSRYLPSNGSPKETSETIRINIGENAHFSSETQGACFGSKSTLKPALTLNCFGCFGRRGEIDHDGAKCRRSERPECTPCRVRYRVGSASFECSDIPTHPVIRPGGLVCERQACDGIPPLPELRRLCPLPEGQRRPLRVSYLWLIGDRRKHGPEAGMSSNLEELTMGVGVHSPAAKSGELVLGLRKEIELPRKEGINQTAAKGGKRPGAGRKPSTIKGIARTLPKETAELLLTEINAQSKWIDLANSTDERIVLETLKYLTDRAFGKARQAIEASAGQGTELRVVVSSILDEP